LQQPELYPEKVTGARADRRELNRMLGKLAPGDVVTVTRIDRLARHHHRALDAGRSRRPHGRNPFEWITGMYRTMKKKRALRFWRSSNKN